MNVLKTACSPAFIRNPVALVGFCLLAICSAVVSPIMAADTEAVEVWEFSPYRVQIWHEIDASVTCSPQRAKGFLQDMAAQLAGTYRATWRLNMTPVPDDIRGLINTRLADFELADLTAQELVVVLAREHEKSKRIRTLAAALSELESIAISASARQRLSEGLAEQDALAEDAAANRLAGKIAKEDSPIADLVEQLVASEIPAAVLSRADVAKVADDVRIVGAQLPWQASSIFSKVDKLIILHVSQSGETLTVQTRELDCPMRFLGPTFSGSTNSLPQLARIASHTITRAFAPIARVEESEKHSAKLRLRAGGLIVHDDNPANVLVGDLMQPIVRRDDRNGVPTLLQPLSWTYAAVTKTDGVQMDANVYTYSNGPGLQGRKNRRTRRILLKVRPLLDYTDVEITVRGQTENVQSGCSIYMRDLITDEFTLLGRTDWRGRFRVPVPASNGRFYPTEVRKAKSRAKRAAQQKAIEAEAAAENADDSAANEATAEPEEEIPTPESFESQALPLRSPLVELYVKNGDTVLASLPLVPGLQAVSVAELRDDSRRLQAEAFVRGFQGEILDLIGLRNLLAAQIKLAIKQADEADLAARAKYIKRAEKSLEELRKLSTYNEMADKLEAIQISMLDERKGKIQPLTRRQIDRLFQTTREMLQKFLQDNLLRDAADEYQKAVGS